ncbi:PKS-ER domain-containing protein [Fusarium sp. LHS14.1]|nr:PKS-ER domain-containing protein [Fusarium sp. LHS14.1]
MATAMQIWQYSSPVEKIEDSLTIKDQVPIPSHSSLGKDELLIKVITASINPVDYKLPESGIIGRIMIPNPATPGLDFCGRVVDKHSTITRFEEGQLVFGSFAAHKQLGTLAQYTVVSAACCALLPEGINPSDGAAVGTAATTAYQSLMPYKLPSAANIFINGGSGGVGTWAIQLAKAMGAKVTTTCSTRNLELCQHLGADNVVDYTKNDVTEFLKQQGAVYDLVIDNVGNRPDLYDNSHLMLKAGGTFVQVGVGESMSLKGIASTMKKQIWPFGPPRFYFVNMKNSTEFFQVIGRWMAEGRVKPVIAAQFDWKDVPEAFRQLQEGRSPGKIVVNVSQDL